MAAQIPLKLIVGGTNNLGRMAAGDTIAASYLDPLVLTTTNTATVSGKTFSGLRINTTEHTDHGAILTSGGHKVLDVVQSTTPDNRARLSTADTTAGVATVPLEMVGGATTIHCNIIPKGASGRLKVAGVEVADISSTQSLSGKTLTQPTIGDFTNANHTHTSTSTGGTLSASAIGSGTLSAARLPSIREADYSGNFASDGGLALMRPVGISYVSEATMGSGTLVADRRYWIPLLAPVRSSPTLTTLKIRIESGWAASRFVKVGVYDNTGGATAPKPNALASVEGVFDLNTGGVAIVTCTLSSPVVLTPGALYWLAFWANTSVPTITTWPTSGVMPTMVLGLNQSGADGMFQLSTNAAPTWGYFDDSSYGSLPSTAPSLSPASTSNGYLWRTGPRWAIGATWSS